MDCFHEADKRPNSPPAQESADRGLIISPRLGKAEAASFLLNSEPDGLQSLASNSVHVSDPDDGGENDPGEHGLSVTHDVWSLIDGVANVTNAERHEIAYLATRTPSPTESSSRYTYPEDNPVPQEPHCSRLDTQPAQTLALPFQIQYSDNQAGNGRYCRQPVYPEDQHYPTHEDARNEGRDAGYFYAGQYTDIPMLGPRSNSHFNGSSNEYATLSRQLPYPAPHPESTRAPSWAPGLSPSSGPTSWYPTRAASSGVDGLYPSGNHSGWNSHPNSSASYRE